MNTAIDCGRAVAPTNFPPGSGYNFHILKKRKPDNQGNPRKPQFCSVPVPERVIAGIDPVFDLQKRTSEKMKESFWA